MVILFCTGVIVFRAFQVWKGLAYGAQAWKGIYHGTEVRSGLGPGV